MVVTIGERVAGPLGGLVAILAYLAPTCLLSLGVARIWTRLENWPWRAAIQHGLAPVSIGLILAGAISLARGALEGWLDAAIAASVFALLSRTKVSPALVVLGGALIGLLVFKVG
jgi:chromate transporter